MNRVRRFRLAAVLASVALSSPRLACSAEQPTAERALADEALEVAKRLNNDFPDSPEAILLMAGVCYQQGNSAEAERCWEKFLTLEPDRAAAYDNLGLLAFERAEFARAAGLFRQALEINPRKPGTHYRLGQTLLRQGKVKEAVTVLEQETALNPKMHLAHGTLGQAYALLGEYEKAVKGLEAAVALKPDYTEGYYALFNACTRLGQKDKAAEYQEKFRKYKAAEVKVVNQKRRSGDSQAAARQNLAHTCAQAGKIYFQRGFLLKAEQRWKRAAELDPDNPQYREMCELLQKK